MSEQGRLQYKEIKVGMTVITLLTIALGVVAFRKFGGDMLPPAQIPPDALIDPVAQDPSRPTVLSADASFSPSSSGVRPSNFGDAWPSSFEGVSGDPRESLMPADHPTNQPTIQPTPGDSTFIGPGGVAPTSPDALPTVNGPIERLNGLDSSSVEIQADPSIDRSAVSPETPRPSLNSIPSRYDAAAPSDQIPPPLPYETFRQPSSDDLPPLEAVPTGQTPGAFAPQEPLSPNPAVNYPLSGEPGQYGQYQGPVTQVQGIQPQAAPGAGPYGAGPYGAAPPPTTYGAPQDYRPNPTAPAYAPPAPVAGPTSMEHVVGPGETMWSIARRLYGTGSFFKALAEHNKREYPNPNDLHVGDVVRTPSVAVLRERYPYLSPKERPRPPAPVGGDAYREASYVDGRTYRVEEGDTLYDIARYELGNGGRWPEIYELNRHVLGGDYDYLKPGVQLVIPARTAAGAVDPIAQLPGGGPQR
jgi:nucleoid-associated protein YgaU